ncbi:MAG TPA: hypothetical protein VL966_01210 [Alphaproteobacteria bacterium]|jgi:hypothetical protein|nr:hypothetical protein [Alphaproteobacteria bacterium]
MPQQQSVLRRFKERLTDATGTAAQPRRWRAFRPALRLRRAANDNRAPLGIILARVVLLTTVAALGIAALF